MHFIDGCVGRVKSVHLYLTCRAKHAHMLFKRQWVIPRLFHNRRVQSSGGFIYNLHGA